MKYINLSLVVAALAVTSCSMFKSNQPQGNQYASSAAQNPLAVQTEAEKNGVTFSAEVKTPKK